MPGWFYRILEWIRLLFGVMPRSGFGSAKIFLVIHYCFMALIAILLAVFSPWILEQIPGLDRRMAALPTWLERIWCGVAFVIVYLIIRIVLYLLELLGIEDDSEFPDIEDDWDEIIEALERERLPIDDIPLFVVNGFTPQQEESAFESSSNIDWKVIAPPITKKSAVVRVYANDDAIFMCCTGVGATNYQQGKVSSAPSGPASGPMPPLGAGVTGTQQASSLQGVLSRPPSPTGTVAPGGLQPVSGGGPGAPPPPPPAASGTAPPTMGGFFGTIAPGGLKRAMETFAALRSSDTKGYGRKHLEPLTEIEMMLGLRRIEFLCSLIIESRRPFCPINGLLQAIPFSWAEDIDYARKLVPAIREDIIAVHEKLQLQFPVVAVVTELDDVPGMKEFLRRGERLQPGLRLSRAGSSFATGADISDSNAEWLIERAVQWFRGWVYSAFSHDMESPENQKLFYMLCAVNQRRKALVSLLRESFYKAVTPGVRLLGCYFCATGPASAEQGFIRGVLDKLPESEGDVAWTPQLEQHQKRQARLSWCFLIAGGLLLAASVFLFFNLGDT